MRIATEYGPNADSLINDGKTNYFHFTENDTDIFINFVRQVSKGSWGSISVYQLPKHRLQDFHTNELYGRFLSATAKSKNGQVVEVNEETRNYLFSLACYVGEEFILAQNLYDSLM